jgi:hypothetical protein
MQTRITKSTELDGSYTRAGLAVRYLENCAVIPHSSDFLAYCAEQRDLRTQLGFSIGGE